MGARDQDADGHRPARGRDAAVGYGAFMSGLGALSGISLSRHVAAADGAPVGRPLSAWLADGVPVEAFGAVGDGIADDTAALTGGGSRNKGTSGGGGGGGTGLPPPATASSPVFG